MCCKASRLEKSARILQRLKIITLNGYVSFIKIQEQLAHMKDRARVIGLQSKGCDCFCIYDNDGGGGVGRDNRFQGEKEVLGKTSCTEFLNIFLFLVMPSFK